MLSIQKGTEELMMSVLRNMCIPSDAIAVTLFVITGISIWKKWTKCQTK